MILGIDASNIRAGGGLTHLIELLGAVAPGKYGFSKVFVWSCSETVSKIEKREWLSVVSPPLLNRGLIARLIWVRFELKRCAQRCNCDVLFVPGGSDGSNFKPMVTMSQNLLPFEWSEMKRYGWTFYALKFLILRLVQTWTFRKADGLIFLTNYAQRVVLNSIGCVKGKTRVISHGVSPRFFRAPPPQLDLRIFSKADPCRVLYVSIVSPYKHQWQVAEAIAHLRSTGIPVVLELVGPPCEGLGRLQETLHRVDPNGEFIAYRGAVAYESLDKLYAGADIGVFASSCENMPNILIEGMAAGLPMACSRKGPMPEVLGDAGVYFNPEDPSDIARALRELVDSAELRAKLAQAAFERANTYSWQRCANETFSFLDEIAREHDARKE
jgi:glycosyltransferase involved in cell wall biosynthesis